MVNQTPSRITFYHVNEDHILNIINKLKNKSSFGHDEISNKLIMFSKEILVQPLTLLVNQMLSDVSFADDTYYQFIDNLPENNVFCIEKYGFRLGHSTELAYIRLIEHIT